jgi:hypothetical protein
MAWDKLDDGWWYFFCIGFTSCQQWSISMVASVVHSKSMQVPAFTPGSPSKLHRASHGGHHSLQEIRDKLVCLNMGTKAKNRSTWAKGSWINSYECPIFNHNFQKVKALAGPLSKRPRRRTLEKNVPMNGRQLSSTGQNIVGWFRSSSPSCIFQDLDNSRQRATSNTSINQTNTHVPPLQIFVHLTSKSRSILLVSAPVPRYRVYGWPAPKLIGSILYLHHRCGLRRCFRLACEPV